MHSFYVQFLTDLMLTCTHLQHLFTTFILPKSIYLFLFHSPILFMLKRKHRGDLFTLYNIMLWNITFWGWHSLVFTGFKKQKKSSCHQPWWWRPFVNTSLISQFIENVISFNFLATALHILRKRKPWRRMETDQKLSLKLYVIVLYQY